MSCREFDSRHPHKEKSPPPESSGGGVERGEVEGASYIAEGFEPAFFTLA